MSENKGRTFYYPERARTYYSPDGRVIGRTSGRGGYFTPEELAKHKEVVRIQTLFDRLLTLDEVRCVDSGATQGIPDTDTARKVIADFLEDQRRLETSVRPSRDLHTSLGISP
jgi:hypothetical protein